MMTDSNQTNLGDQFVMYRNIRSPFRGPRINIVLQVNYTSKKEKKNSQKKRLYLWLPEVGSRQRKNWMEVVKIHKLPVIKQISTRECCAKYG